MSARGGGPAAEDLVFLARQPIFDSELKAYGYELLFRSGGENFYTGASAAGDGRLDGSLASSHTISRALHTIGLGAIAGGKRLFVNFTKELLLEDVYTLLPPGQLVVELLEATVVDDEVIAACHKLKAAGYQLALDDVTYPCKVNPLLELADFLKIDFRELPREDRGQVCRDLSRLPGVLLAEKVETKEEFDEAVALGCKYVQGFFFAKPELMKGKGLVGIKAVYLEFMQELNQPELNYDALEQLIKQDASLAYKLLRYLNSSALGLPERISSVKQALVLLGEKAMRKWGSLVVATSMNHRRPPELLLMCLARAHFCERVAEAQNLHERKLEMFLIGLLSGIDALLDQPMQTVLNQLAVPEDVRAVLLGHCGTGVPAGRQAGTPAPLGRLDLERIYRLAQACERGDWATVIQLLPSAGSAAALRQTQAEIAMMYYEALTWADQIFALAA